MPRQVRVFNPKQSEAELTASVLKKRSETHKKLEEHFLIGRDRTKRAKFHKCARFVLFRPIKKRSFNLLCVLDLFRFVHC